MEHAIEETDRRRDKQVQYNLQHGITPVTITKPIPEKVTDIDDFKLKPSHDIKADIKLLREQMEAYSKALNFENAIECRDRPKKT